MQQNNLQSTAQILILRYDDYGIKCTYKESVKMRLEQGMILEMQYQNTKYQCKCNLLRWSQTWVE